MPASKSTNFTEIPKSVDTLLTQLPGVSVAVAKKLAKLNLFTVSDLLFHLPLRYEDRTYTYPINQLHAGLWASVKGSVMHSEVIFARRKMFIVKISDGNGSITLRFFNFTSMMKNIFSNGTLIHAYGEIKRGTAGLEIIHPAYKVLHEDQHVILDQTLTPIYPTTEKLHQLTLRNLTDQALDILTNTDLPELLPDNLYPLQMTLKQALHTIHRPQPNTNLELFRTGQHPAQLRLIIEELLAQNLSMLQLKTKNNQEQSFPLTSLGNLKTNFLSQLPFSPTAAQVRVVVDIEHDLAKSSPMMRLLQGDVGSGKTLVAALTAICAIENGYQVALMAPTELLAEQHAINFSHWFEPLGINVGWLASKLTSKKKLTQLENIAAGMVQIVIGTHSLFQEQVQFNCLALIIIDEQHRFGVAQRLELRQKGFKGNCYPHQLVMTATPIPRTLAMTAYADLDVSIIDELPAGRIPITTVAISDVKRSEIIKRIEHACLFEKKQAYWVCTLIDVSEVLEAQAASDTAENLQALMPDLKIGLVHGKMKPAQKQAVMQSFKNNELHLLVATTVIEVGVDVPNASLMIIENPERLGLAQLHQLRGRVGRGSVASHCILLYKSPLSKNANKRLAVLRESNDGFIIAQKDLEIRGPGEVLGVKQTGLADFKIADLVRDQHLIPQIQQMAIYIHQNYPKNVDPIITRWLGYKNKYSNA